MSEAMALVTDDVPRDEPGSAVAVPAPVADQEERFIPVDRHDLIQHLIDNGPWGRAERDVAADVLHSMARLRQQRSLLALDRLMYAYDPFNPDDETVNFAERKTAALDAMQTRLFADLETLIKDANFKEIDIKALDSLLSRTSPYGVAVHVDRSDFDTMRLYYRGTALRTEQRRDWRWLYLRHRTIEVQTFSRLFLALKLKPDAVRAKELMASKAKLTEAKAMQRIQRMRAKMPKGSSSDFVYLKLFKRIAQADLDMLFPNTQVKLSLRDKIRLGATAGGSTLFGLIGFATKVLTAALLTPVALLLALGGLFGVIFNQVMNFFNMRNKYMMTLAQNLYFHNLANNQGVIALLIDEAEEEDIKEAALLYTYLIKTPGDDRREDVKRDVEQFLLREFGLGPPFAFDIDDASDKLVATGLARRTESGQLAVMPLGEAQWHLARAWIMERDRRAETA